jgi:hypothetical protein
MAIDPLDGYEKPWLTVQSSIENILGLSESDESWVEPLYIHDPWIKLNWSAATAASLRAMLIEAGFEPVLGFVIYAMVPGHDTYGPTASQDALPSATWLLKLEDPAIAGQCADNVITRSDPPLNHHDTSSAVRSE